MKINTNEGVFKPTKSYEDILREPEFKNIIGDFGHSVYNIKKIPDDPEYKLKLENQILNGKKVDIYIKVGNNNKENFREEKEDNKNSMMEEENKESFWRSVYLNEKE